MLGDKGVREYAQAARLVKFSHPQVQCALVAMVVNIVAKCSLRSRARLERGGSREVLGALLGASPDNCCCC